MSELWIRNAEPDDAETLARLFATLDHHSDADSIRRRLDVTSGPTLVAEWDEKVIGACGLAMACHIHRAHKLGRVTILVVDAAWQGKGIGRALLGEAESRLRDAGCAILEITSHNRLTEAHAFYRRMGYEQTSQRFAKTL